MNIEPPDPSKVSRAAILCHRHADPDTYLSAFALSRMLRDLTPKASVSIVTPDGMSILTKKLAESFPQGGVEEEEEDDYDLILAVDIGRSELLGEAWSEKLRRSRARKILVDHHPLQEAAPYDQTLVDTTSSSAAELVFLLAKQWGVGVDRQTAQALLIAIIFDSQFLSLASARTLRTVLELIEAGASLEEAKASLRSPPDYGEVIAKLKAARRSKIYRCKGWVIAVSTVGSFQANVARSLTQLGADLALVVGRTDSELRGSLRAHQRFNAETKIHVGSDVAEAISRGRGYGGGHPTAASFTLTSGDELSTIADFLSLIEKALGERPVEVT